MRSADSTKRCLGSGVKALWSSFASVMKYSTRDTVYVAVVPISSSVHDEQRLDNV